MLERRCYENINTLSTAVADFAADRLHAALQHNAVVSLVIPGGNTPKFYLPALARLSVNWQNVIITLSDERWVDTHSQGSNEFLIRSCFLNCMDNPARFISLKTTHDHPSLALSTLTDRLSQLPLPINLAILGLGEDGHIASIFPGHPINSASNSLCEVATPPIAPSIRISLAFSLLASSHHIIIVVTGQNKRRRLEQFIDSQDPQIPFMRLVQETHSPITIFESN
ncbi:MAG: 6-phosphogluconolactonase [Nitrosomonas sp.]|nr:6-phosphogluconolactonase [Nitrosomonas sp.]